MKMGALSTDYGLHGMFMNRYSANDATKEILNCSKFLSFLPL